MARRARVIEPVIPAGYDVRYRVMLVREEAVAVDVPAIVMQTPEDVSAYMHVRSHEWDDGREHFWTLLLNTKNHLVGAYEVSVGSLNASIVHPRELFRSAVMMGAASVVVTHNHPSGDPTPSGADIQLTRRLVKAGDVLGIELLDHVIVTDNVDTQASLRELGLM